ncbi:MAG: hypothetical protein JWN86_2238 [Planctomycetota bacterium]|nr:hypothetical protein [Planctomycetota bacterium]
MRTLIRTCSILAALVLSMPIPTLAGGPGGGTQAPKNPLVGSWLGARIPDGGPFRYHFTFNKNFTYTLVETDAFTGLPTASFAGTYTLGGVGPNGFTVLTMVSQGEIIFQAEVSPAFEGIWLRVSPSLVIGMGKL